MLITHNVKQSLRVGIPKSELGNETKTTLNNKARVVMRKKTSCLNESVDKVVRRNMLSHPMNCTLPRYSVKLFIIGCFCSIMVTACMWYPIARNDFSVLGDDIFSSLIKETYSKSKGCDAFTFKSCLDKTEANKIAKKTMSGKTEKEIVALFRQEGGQCSSITQDANEKLLICSVIRTWRLKNIGAPFDTSNWSDPAAKLLYRFSLDNSETVTIVELELINVTKHKEIRG